MIVKGNDDFRCGQQNGLDGRRAVAAGSHIAVGREKYENAGRMALSLDDMIITCTTCFFMSTSIKIERNGVVCTERRRTCQACFGDRGQDED